MRETVEIRRFYMDADKTIKKDRKGVSYTLDQWEYMKGEIALFDPERVYR